VAGVRRGSEPERAHGLHHAYASLNGLDLA
jgi:hypothetical protein